MDGALRASFGWAQRTTMSSALIAALAQDRSDARANRKCGMSATHQGTRGVDRRRRDDAALEADKYKYGFVTDVEQDRAPPGLSEDTVASSRRRKTSRHGCWNGAWTRFSAG